MMCTRSAISKTAEPGPEAGEYAKLYERFRYDGRG
jgi:hypothetical protein